MRPSSFKRDGWILILPMLVIVSGFFQDPLHAVVIVTVMAGGVGVVAVSVVVSIRRRLQARSPQSESVASPH